MELSFDMIAKLEMKFSAMTFRGRLLFSMLVLEIG